MASDHKLSEKSNFVVCASLWFLREWQMQESIDGWVDTGSQSVARLHLLWFPLLLCCCSHPLAGITDKPHLVLYGRMASLSVTEVEGQQVPLLHNALLTEQHNKILLILECWVIYQTCIAPVRIMTECSCHCTVSSLWNRCNSLQASENKECIFCWQHLLLHDEKSCDAFN